MLLGPQVAFVDDIKREITPLENVLKDRHTGTVFFDASTDKNRFPEKPLETVKLLFLDLYYKPTFDAELSAQWVQSIIPPHSDYTLVIWSKDTHQQEELLTILDYIELTPTRVEAWQKTDFDLENHNFSKNIDDLITTISGEPYYVEDILFGEIINVTDEGVFINCRLNDEKPTFQLRKFDKKLLGNIEKVEAGIFVRIHINSKPGARRMDVFEEKKDRSDLFEQPDFFKGLDGNAFFIESK
ncbi:MAG: hypothetical protein ABIX36_17230 [Mucilaginibacter sp.]|uniref:hypothetical protein n=1 Tax=Mucilaginibacter sp. TaxID=1882438 RepID=UPI0032635D47